MNATQLNLTQLARGGELLAKMAKLPDWATHAGIATTPMGVTIVAGAAGLQPMVCHPITREWVPLQMKTDGGILL